MNARRLAVFLVLGAPAALAAQSGLYAPLIQQLPSGPRTLGLGNTGIASRDDEVIFFNPAQVAIARGMSASAERYSKTAGGGSVSAASAFANGGIAIGARVVNYEVPTSFFPADRGSMLDAGSPAASYEASIGIGQTWKGVRGGIAGKYATELAPDIRAGRAMVDVGLAKDFSRVYTVGLAVQNIGNSMAIPCSVTRGGSRCMLPTSPLAADNSGTSRFAASNVAANDVQVDTPIRTTLGVGATRSVGEFDLAGTAAVSLLRTEFVIPSGGIEANYSWLSGYNIALRAGARRPIAGEDAFTAGAGFTMDRLSIDYALETLSGGRVGHRIGLRVR
jgi:hypothetical protein